VQSGKRGRRESILHCLCYIAAREDACDIRNPTHGGVRDTGGNPYIIDREMYVKRRMRNLDREMEGREQRKPGEIG
jgi:hypothetical protein